jgi:pimeloyl-ACP methyl ester carboxylesterase
LYGTNFEWITKALVIPEEAMVKGAIETRELINVEVGGICVRGTYHRSREERSSSKATSQIGVLFLNHGFLPRAAPGDSAVYWAESFANCGYPSFRFDLPGLGDSDGDIPNQILDFINAGGYAPMLSATVKDLVARFSLSGMVIIGHCAGAVTALYTAAVSKDCRGLVLTDPYFFLPRERTKIREELNRWSSRSRLGSLISTIHYWLKHIHLLTLRNRPPRNANLPLLRCWNQLASAGMPMLVMKAPALKSHGIKPRMGEFDYLGYLAALTGCGSRVVVEFIEGTNHSFADAVGREAIRRHTESWLKVCFPIPGGVSHPDSESSSVPLRGARSADSNTGRPQLLNLDTAGGTGKSGSAR